LKSKCYFFGGTLGSQRKRIPISEKGIVIQSIPIIAVSQVPIKYRVRPIFITVPRNNIASILKFSS
jgi:hypothetical protein